jgi:hypothetical protein
MTSIAMALTGSGSKKAAGAQAAAGEIASGLAAASLRQQIMATEDMLATQKDMLDDALSRTEPYTQAGYSAMAMYESMIYGVPLEQTATYKSAQYERKIAQEKANFKPSLPEGAKPVAGHPNMYMSADESRKYLVNPDGSITEMLRGEGPDPGHAYRGDFKPSEPPPDTTIDSNLVGSVDPMGVLRRTPGYGFRMQEGEKALERSASMRSGVLSGSQIKASQRYGQDYATNEFDKYLDRLAGIITTGANAASGQATGILNNANTQGNISLQGQQNVQTAYSNMAGAQMQIGAARASGYLGQQAQGTSLLNNMASIAGSYAGRPA